ncbi:hypothetical protein AWC02_00455 [Mycolicibacter engbaekii]|uniref:LpqJ protein n=1 Tax=Mycolicibacter engbaekii TaxID=188915 RepID=A0A1X1U457_9MYCO|nr:hypothetical protein AWC02_00455 [Mycolicibacter engbaekii]
MLLAGCSTTVDGHPTAAPGGGGPPEPSLRPPRTTTTPSSPPSPTPSATPNQPADAIPLPPDDNGYVFIETKSGRTRCQISSPQVDCEAEFTNSPLKDGQHANGVSVSADGTVQWVLGNLGDIPVVTIDYLTYRAQGWTINADIDGTRFTNDRTGHGMVVSIDNVDTF